MDAHPNASLPCNVGFEQSQASTFLEDKLAGPVNEDLSTERQKERTEGTE